MNLQQFRVFASVARNHSITKASLELHSSQSALSQHLKNLQAQFGILFQKNGRRLELTHHGQSLLNEIEPLVSQLYAIEKKYGANSSEPNVQSLTVAVSHGPSVSLLPSLLARFRNLHPSAALTLHTGSSRGIEESLLASKVDIGIVTNPTLISAFWMEPYRMETVTGFVPAGHPLAKKHKIAWADISATPLVVMVRQGQSRIEELFTRSEKEDLNLNIALRCESAESVKEAVRSGAGVGILYYDVVKREIDRGEFKVVKLAGIDLTGRSYIVYLKEKPLSSIAREFLALLRGAVRRQYSASCQLF